MKSGSEELIHTAIAAQPQQPQLKAIACGDLKRFKLRPPENNLYPRDSLIPARLSFSSGKSPSSSPPGSNYQDTQKDVTDDKPRGWGEEGVTGEKQLKRGGGESSCSSPKRIDSN
ncbi:hypothetical protein INR49_022675, partial [Caranx melampygus]